MSEWDETTLSQEELTAFMVLAGSIGEYSREIERLSAENSRLKSQLDEFVYAENNPTYESEAERLSAENERLWDICHAYAERDIDRVFGDLRRAIDEIPGRVSTVPAPDGINDRGSDEYANPVEKGLTQK